MKITACLALTALSIALTGASASAATFNYNIDETRVSHESAGVVKGISTSFNDTNQLFNWSSTFRTSELNNSLADGAWLVVNNGPNPRADVAEQVIFYLDGLNQKVSAYNYAGTPTSWQTSTHLGTKDLAVSNNGEDRTFSFNWNMASINAMTDTFGDNWKGTAFDENIGIWFHGIDGLNVEYDDDHSLSSFRRSSLRTVFDIANRAAVVSPEETPTAEPGAPVSPEETPTAVPEPGIALALGITAVAATFTKSRKRAAA